MPNWLQPFEMMNLLYLYDIWTAFNSSPKKKVSFLKCTIHTIIVQIQLFIGNLPVK